MQLQAELTELYTVNCCHNSPLGDGGKLSFTPSGDGGDDLAHDLAAMIEDIWKAKGMPYTINKEVANAFAKELWSGTTKGYGKDFTSIAYNSPDYEMLKNLQNSVYHFSAAKNYQQLKSLTQALIGDNDKLKSYSQFKEAAFAINDTHVNQWLKTEYNTAIASGQMAGKWVGIEANKDRLGMLEFDAVIDGRTTELCYSLNGVLKPVNDPFWNKYYPPNHFGCRSTIRQRSGTYATPDAKIVYPEIPAIFQTNLAKEGLVFPQGHPYFKDVPADVLKEAVKLQTKEIREWAKDNLIGKEVTVKAIGKVSFTNQGIKEILNQPHKYRMERNQFLYVIESALKNATHVRTAPDVKGNVMVKDWHYLKIKIAGENSYAVVKELATGEKILYSIVDHLK